MSEANVAELLTLTKEISEVGDIYYRNKEGQLHRIHGPAIIWIDGSSFWCKNGLLDREDGPAVENTDGRKEWWENGKCIRREYS